MTLFGRTLRRSKDELDGYRVEKLGIKDQSVIEKSGTEWQPILIFVGLPSAIVQGMVFELSEEELIQVDLFEVDDYSRKKGLTKSGMEVWIYIANTNNENKSLSSFFDYFSSNLLPPPKLLFR